MAKIKVQITLEEELMRDIDDYCDKHYMNRSWFISQNCIQALNQQKMIDAMVNISIACKNISESGNIDEETRKEMERFETICKMYLGK